MKFYVQILMRYRVGDIVDIRVNGAVQQGLVFPATWLFLEADDESCLEEPADMDIVCLTSGTTARRALCTT